MSSFIFIVLAKDIHLWSCENDEAKMENKQKNKEQN